MSRIAKWKLEKTKVKVVFRLQFHATNIPQTGWDKLFVSFIPADSLKATAKTSKASVRNGTCKWADPIYETTRLIQDTKSKQYEDKYYKLVVAMGSSRSGFLGEGIINLADYADASQPSAIALPLQGCNFATILHVAVQPLTSKTGFREFEQQRELRETGLQTTVQGDYNGSTANLASTGEMARDQVNGRVRFKSESKDLPALEEVEELNEDYADSTTGIDVSSTTSGSLYADKHDSSTHEIDSLKSTTSGDLAGLSLNQSPNPDKGDHRNVGQGGNDWVHAWSSDYSMDNDLAAAYEENSRLKGSLDMAESSILELKLEVTSLQNLAKELGSKTLKFDKVLDAEVLSGKELAKEVSILKSECSKFKYDYEQLKDSTSSHHLTSGDIVAEDQALLFQTLHMGWMQGLLVMEENVRSIQNKGCHDYHGGDFRYLQPELESLEKVLHDLKQVTIQGPSSLDVKPAPADMKHSQAMRFEESEKFISGNRLLNIGTDLYSGRSPQLSQEPDHYVSTVAFEAKISGLRKELEESKFERDSLTKKLDQMECYYEALIQELEESQKQMLGELQSLRTEHSTCFYTISSCKTQMEAMHQDMNTQFVRFVEDKRDLVSLNKELEERAITSETALKKARWNHSVAVGQLQKDLELLSFQVLSMFQTNENLIKQAFKESSLDCYQDYLEEKSEAVDSCLQKKNGARNLDTLDMLMDSKTELPITNIKKRVDSTKSDAFKPLQSQEPNEDKQLMSGDIHFVDLKRTLRLQEELYQKAEDELGEMHMVNLNLYIFSKVLQETLQESTNGIKLMKQKLGELAEQLEHSTVSNELLMIRLQATLDDVNAQKEINADCVRKYNELASHNQMMEEKFQGVYDENSDLIHKISDYESLVMEYRSYESKFDVCTSEKNELLNLLKQENLDKYSLQNEVIFLHDELRNLKTDFDIQSSFKGDLEKKVSSLQDELALQTQVLEEKLQGLSDENGLLAQKVSECESSILEYKDYERKYELSTVEKTELENSSRQESLEKGRLQHEVGSLQEELRTLKSDFDSQFSLKGNLERTVTSLQDKLSLENHMLEEKLKGALDENSILAQKVLEYEKVKLKYESDIQGMANKLDTSMGHLARLQLEIEDITNKLKLSSENEERYAANTQEMSSKLAAFEAEVQNVTGENRDLVQKILALENVNAELESTKLILADSERQREAVVISLNASNEALENVNAELERTKLAVADSERQSEALVISLNASNEALENVSAELERTKLAVADSERQSEAMVISLNASNEVSVKLKDELKSAKENLGCMRDELLSETTSRVELENKVADLSSQLNMKNDQLLSLEAHKSELLHLKQLVADIEHEKSRVCHLLLLSEESGRKADADVLSLQARVSDLECHLAALHGIALAADIELVYTRSQFLSRTQELVQQLETLDSCYRELHIKHLAVLNTVNDRISSKAQYVEENAVLLSTLSSLRSELEATAVERKSLLDRIKAISEELENHKNRADIAESNVVECTSRHELEIAHLKHALLSSQEEANDLLSSQEELDTTIIVIKSKLDEQYLQISLLEDELTQLRDQQKELTRRLSEQSLKTEEFKNLSIHLKELKDRAEAECVQAREKKEAEGQSVVAQESLRMVFMRDQCETKVQEMRNQILVSKKHGEEMLFKLQDALGEVENLKKVEASLIKRNEEQSVKILDLESELQRVLAEKREKVNAYDRMQAELECSLISLECCKEEKQKLEASLQECNEERYKITVELNSVKERLESLASSTILQEEGIRKSVVDEDSCRELEDASQVPVQDGVVSRSVVRISRQASAGQKGLLQNDAHHLALIDEHAKAQSIMSSMDNLHHELERMKNENLGSIHPHEQQHCQSIFQGLEREQLQLHKTNEELGSIFPLFSEFSSCGNALERVLALEMELAESLKAKKKSGFQSSFLKQHSDEEAIFQSFKDINDLIKDMLEMKGRYVTVETELKEMHDRYSQLSLQLAEVEGERQKLVMTLKNARSPKRLPYL
ncbi:myosin-2 heavy chain-like [Papaver somniferum]|uniref:myosin-2 heavy chain-like n=1 Tax=Papaver somniferum TaxID=3469 RepID=UPI000E7051EB|nr:myosin-2 heavy chain-like [Papaver somniferum]XP_026391364.1 myosin-2 heavy chain-like [Papaver somniferum]